VKAPISRLHNQVADLARFIQFAINIEKVRTSQLLTESPVSEEIVQYAASTSWRRHAYASTIVALYGTHERFVRDFSSEVADVLSRVYESYDRLPEQLRKVHEQLTVERAKEILTGRGGTYQDFRVALGNLHACLDGSMSINRDVFSSSTANFRHDVVREILSRLGLSVGEFSEDPELFEIIRTTLNGLYSSVSSVINDLADRRNEIAHGSDFEILDLGTMRAIIAAVYRYDCWLYSSCARSLLNIAVIERAELVAEIRRTFRNSQTGMRSIGSVKDVNVCIRPNDVIYLLKNGEVVRTVVGSIQKDNLAVKEATPGAGPYGLDFGCVVREGTQLRRLPARHAALATILGIAMQEKPEMPILPGDNTAQTQNLRGQTTMTALG
jgi:hypothetical protein